MADTKNKKKTASQKKTTKSTSKKNTSKKNEDLKYVGSSKTKKSYAEKQQTYAICFIAVGVLFCCFAFIPGIKVWASIRGALFAVCGVGFFLLTALMFILGIIAATNKFSKSPSTFVYLSLAETVIFSSLVHVITNDVGAGGFAEWKLQVTESIRMGWEISSSMRATGGAFGSAIGGLFLQAFGKTAALATLIILFIVFTMLLTGLTFNIIGKSIREVSSHVYEKGSEKHAVRKIERAEAKEREKAEKKRLEEESLRIKALEEEEKRQRREAEEMRRQELLRKAEENKANKPDEKEAQGYNVDIDKLFASDKTVIDASKDDDPIANSNNPNFRFTNPFIHTKKEPEEEKPNPYTHPEKKIQELEAEKSDDSESADKQPFDEIITKGEQLSFEDGERDELLAKANAEAKENQKRNRESVEGFKDTSSMRRSVYKLPPITCLNQPKFGSDADFTAEMKNISQKLLETLRNFGVETTLVGVSRGPSVTRYELQPAPGVKISKITNLADDIALSLAASGVRIEAPIPNKSAVGIEVPNKARAMVTLREIIATPDYQNAKSKLNVALGKDITGNIRCADLAKMPHLLIAGTTGSGKSVLLNCMIVSILYNATPDEVKLLMIDPKQVEFSVYNGIPHLLVPVISNVRKAAGSLAWAVTEMENRYKAFSECSVRDISGFNRYVESHPELNKMPQIVIFIDELNDLMMISPKEVEDSICRLAQKARAAGMHLVVATQRPSVDVITGIIKANIPSRISLSVSSQVDSRTILDSIGAEKLLGNGDMLYNPVGRSKPERIQGAFLSDGEIEKIVDFLKKQGVTQYDDNIMEEIEKQAAQEKKKGTGSSADGDSDDGERDAMFESAIEVVVELGQASTTLLQRKLRLGYARAARVMEQLEESGIVGPQEGSKPRKVLITKQQLLEMKAMAENSEE
ncbi:MAG: DNA translocase FtsK [Acutalibacteraceae bacterium]